MSHDYMHNTLLYSVYATLQQNSPLTTRLSKPIAIHIRHTKYQSLVALRLTPSMYLISTDYDIDPPGPMERPHGGAWPTVSGAMMRHANGGQGTAHLSPIFLDLVFIYT